MSLIRQSPIYCGRWPACQRFLGAPLISQSSSGADRSFAFEPLIPQRIKGPLVVDHPSDGDYVIYSLVDGPLGIAFITGAIDRVPVIVPSPGFYPQKFHVQLVDESKHIYVIKVDGKNTREGTAECVHHREIKHQRSVDGPRPGPP
ncbi:hypothetical protein M404DRAFT_860719 [Pisolithus tinctorius Marx 270]|uniref:Uncharacterized protein n=1 Tax=Pisolithus tinctorius Marx 270 TaxID=870435 RepID=A0A0C3IM76_PISTI|nr:hypothetical protein M404DRAFT_860719 [Pisolithus tinctorius Marx 270]